MVVVPKTWQLRGIGIFNGGAFNSDFTTLHIAVHVVLTTTANHIPLSTISNTVVTVGHIARINRLGKCSIFSWNILPPSIIRMECVGVVPRIIHHLWATMIVGSHHKGIILSELHEPLGFWLVCVSIWMCAAMWVWIVAIHIYTIGIGTSCTRNSVVTTIIGTVRVGVGKDKDVQIVDQVDYAWIRACTKFIN